MAHWRKRSTKTLSQFVAGHSANTSCSCLSPIGLRSYNRRTCGSQSEIALARQNRSSHRKIYRLGTTSHVRRNVIRNVLLVAFRQNGGGSVQLRISGIYEIRQAKSTSYDTLVIEGEVRLSSLYCHCGSNGSL